jgi:hypothetical protein
MKRVFLSSLIVFCTVYIAGAILFGAWFTFMLVQEGREVGSSMAYSIVGMIVLAVITIIPAIIYSLAFPGLVMLLKKLGCKHRLVLHLPAPALIAVVWAVFSRPLPQEVAEVGPFLSAGFAVYAGLAIVAAVVTVPLLDRRKE